jgi:hypothetical protein
MKDQNLKIVLGIQARLDLGFLETLLYIRANSAEFTLAELRAYHRVTEQFQELFAVKEAA